jgi:hypothetical protein
MGVYFSQSVSSLLSSENFNTKILKSMHCFLDYNLIIIWRLVSYNRGGTKTLIKKNIQLIKILTRPNQIYLVLSDDQNSCKWGSSVGSYMKNTKSNFKKSIRRDFFIWLSFLKLSFLQFEKQKSFLKTINFLQLTGTIKNYLMMFSFFFKMKSNILFDFIFLSPSVSQHKTKVKKIKSIKKNLIKRLYKLDFASNKNLINFRKHSLQANEVKRVITQTF